MNDHLAEPLRLGDPVRPRAARPLRTRARAEYVSFAHRRAAGAAINELEDGAAVNDLLVLNPTDQAILLYEGEEILGAQQNRTFDVSVLVGTRSQLQVPVSCVEAGRWDGGRHDESFSPAPQAACPPLRSSHEVIVNLIAATTTRTGLTVQAALDTDPYPKGIKITDADMQTLDIAPYDFHGDWNYTIHPRHNRDIDP